MIRINLIPPSERASLKVIRTSLIVGIVASLILIFLSGGAVFIRWQVATEKSRLASYKETVAAMGRYQKEQAALAQQARDLSGLMEPLQTELDATGAGPDLELFLARAANKAAGTNVWLRECSLQRDGTLSVAGYGVEFGDVSRFLAAVGERPFTVQASSTEWVMRDGARVLQFSARIAAVKEGAET